MRSTTTVLCRAGTTGESFICAPAGGRLTDTVVDGLTGDLVPPRDQRRLGAAIRGLLDDRMRRLAYSAAALDRVAGWPAKRGALLEAALRTPWNAPMRYSKWFLAK